MSHTGVRQSTEAFDGLKVVEVGDTIAAAAAGALFLRLGAEVFKEPATGRPPTRVDRGLTQRDRLLELLDRGKTRLGPLAREGIPSACGDVMVVDLSECSWQRDVNALRDYCEHVRQTNSGAWVTLSPFGLEGPLAACRGSELTAVAAGGMANYTRSGVGRPMKPAGFAASIAAGHFAVLAALHGLLLRRGGACAPHMDVSVQDTIIATGVFLECAHRLFDCSGEGGAARYAAPRGLIPCGTGYIWIVVLEDHQWRGCVEAMGHPAWAQGITDSIDRERGHDLIQQGLADWASQFSAREASERLQAQGVPAAPVNSPADLLEGIGADVRDGFFVRGARAGELLPDIPFETMSFGASGAEADCDRGGAGRYRLLDLTQVLVGPLATSWLGAMGIDVLKVEDPGRVDIYRRRGPFLEDVAGPERSAYFSFANYSKRSHAVQCETKAGRERLDRLVASADVVVHNLVQRAVALGVTPEHVHGELGTMLVSCSGYGCSTRYAAHRAYGMNVQAAGGVVDLTRDRDGNPVNLGTSWADPLASVWIAITTVAQLLRPRWQRQSIDVSMVEVVASEFKEYFSALTAEALELQREETRLDHAAPHGIYHSLGHDRWFALSIETDREWQALLDVLGRPESLDRPHWVSLAGRLADEDELDAQLDEVFRHRGGWRLFEELQALDIACAPVLGAADLVSLRHLHDRRLFQPVNHPVCGERLLIGLPWLVDGQAVSIEAAPVLGADTTADWREWWRQ